jgi:hypothetical protein
MTIQTTRVVASWAFAIALTLGSAVVQVQSPMPDGMPPPPGMSLAASSAMRFPQPVRVGDLLHRLVLQPVESQIILVPPVIDFTAIL